MIYFYVNTSFYKTYLFLSLIQEIMLLHHHMMKLYCHHLLVLVMLLLLLLREFLSFDLTHSYYYLSTSDIVSLYRQTHVTERQARDSLLQLAGQRFCWGKKAAQDMVISSITSSSAFHVSIMWC